MIKHICPICENETDEWTALCHFCKRDIIATEAEGQEIVERYERFFPPETPYHL